MSSRSTSPAWTPITTQQLSGGPLYYDILDHFNRDGDEQAARNEVLNATSLMGALRPSKAKSDSKIAALLGGFVGDSLPTSRGDLSIFLAHETRSSDSFAAKYPALHNLLSLLETTVKTQLKGDQFDIDQNVSVQLALYPGDGESGYPQHCDVSGACCQHNNSQSSTRSRIITAIYYLTPEDWSSDLDAGHLRLFSSSEGSYEATPFSGRCLVMRSDKVLHQVMPSKRRDRLALTMWFYGSVKETQDSIPKQIASARVSPSNPATQSTTLPPALPLSGEDTQSETIFVSIASFRDSETGPTIRAMMETAQYPARITVGVVLQYDCLHDASILQDIPTSSNVRLLTLHAKDARGPCYARRLAQHLYDAEDYILQIDSHMRFRKHWDSYLIQQLPIEAKSMLTTYPVGYQLPNTIPNETRPTLLVPDKFDSNGMLRQKGRLLQRNMSKPMPTHLYAAGFNFSRASTNYDCPYPSTWRIFFGEEVYRTAQLHAAGYQLFAPPETVVYHLWSRKHRPVHDCVVQNDVKADQELRAYLDRQQDLWEAMGVDWANRQILHTGECSEYDFCDGDVSELVDQATLDGNVKDLIQSFLAQV